MVQQERCYLTEISELKVVSSIYDNTYDEQRKQEILV